MSSKKKNKKRKTPPALKLSDSDLRQLFEEALKAHRHGKLEAAENLYRKILSNIPEHEGALNMLGVITMQQGNWGAAKKLIEKAIKAKPDYSEAHCNMGILLLNIGDLEEAESYLKKAIDTSPGYARAHCNLAQVYRKKSLWKEAIENFEKAARFEPALGEAWEGLLELKELDLNSPLIGILEKSAEKVHPHLPFFHYLLGKAYDDTGNPEKALVCFEKANELEQRIPRNQMTPEEHEKYINILIETFNKDYFMEHKERGSEKAPVFLIGMPCSGISFIEKIISTNPKAQIINSKPLGSIAQNIIEKNNSNPIEAFKSLDEKIIKISAEKYLKTFDKTDFQTVCVDSSPLNIFNLWLAEMLFPNAKIIFSKRDPIDLCMASYFSGAHPLSRYTIPETAHFYRILKKLEENWKNSLSIRFIEVNFNDIICNTKKSAKKILDFCNLDYLDKCAEIPGLRNKSLDIQRNYPEVTEKFKEALKADG